MSNPEFTKHRAKRTNPKRKPLTPQQILKNRNLICNPNPLRDFRIRLNMNQTQFAVEVLGLSPHAGTRTVSEFERGVRIPLHHVDSITKYAASRGLLYDVERGVVGAVVQAMTPKELEGALTPESDE